MEQLIREWLAAHASPAVLATICGIVLAVTQAVKVILDGLAEDGVCPRITRLTAFPLAWPILAASIGAVSGLALVGLSLTGAAVGVLTAMIASGGFSWLKKSAEAAGRSSAVRKSQMLCVLLLCSALLAAGGGCSIPEAVLRTAQFEQLQLDSDKALIDRVFDDRAASNEALIRGLDTALEQAIKGRASLDAAWVLETVRGNDALKALLRSRQRQDEVARQTILDNFDRRKDALGRAGELAIRSQAWSSETAQLVRDLLAETLKEPGETPLAPVGEVAPTVAAPAPAESK